MMKEPHRHCSPFGFAWCHGGGVSPESRDERPGCVLSPKCLSLRDRILREASQGGSPDQASASRFPPARSSLPAGWQRLQKYAAAEPVADQLQPPSQRSLQPPRPRPEMPPQPGPPVSPRTGQALGSAGNGFSVLWAAHGERQSRLPCEQVPRGHRSCGVGAAGSASDSSTTAGSAGGISSGASTSSAEARAPSRSHGGAVVEQKRSRRADSDDGLVPEVSLFIVGDRAVRRGEPCKVVAVDEVSMSCTVRMEKDGREVDTRQEDLLRFAASGGSPAAARKEGDRGCCAECGGQMSKDERVQYCGHCGPASAVHRRCLLGLSCTCGRCPAGHPLTERDSFGKQIACDECGERSRVYGFSWQCEECSWSICRECLLEELDTTASCPVCFEPLFLGQVPSHEVLQGSGVPPSAMSADIVELLFSRPVAQRTPRLASAGRWRRRERFP